ncbi:hypothetical protein Taro_056743, partial [Colocasia esculenta]|nr:hypothetical protein [Colocasia esculenta]
MRDSKVGVEKEEEKPESTGERRGKTGIHWREELHGSPSRPPHALTTQSPRRLCLASRHPTPRHPRPRHPALVPLSRAHAFRLAQRAASLVPPHGRRLQPPHYIKFSGDQVYIPFFHCFKSTETSKSYQYYDDAWCTIIPNRLGISLGRVWMDERRVIIDHQARFCLIHLEGYKKHFRVYDSFYIALQKFIKRCSVFSAMSEASLALRWDQRLIAEVGFDLFKDTLFEEDPLLTVDVWNQTLFVRSELGRISSDIFAAPLSILTPVDGPALADVLPIYQTIDKKRKKRREETSPPVAGASAVTTVGPVVRHRGADFACSHLPHHRSRHSCPSLSLSLASPARGLGERGGWREDHPTT